jgi:uncharacterized protein YicC (UPF0701 family)
MPIYSMTGFARVQVRVCQRPAQLHAHVKSVNHRFLDVQLRLPSGLDALEMELRKALKDAGPRPRGSDALRRSLRQQQKAGYNRELVAGYLPPFRRARGALG